MSVLPILPQGFVVGRILTSRGDSADADKQADTAVVVGMVDFTPATAYRKLDATTVVTHSKITAQLDSHGDLHPQRETSDNTGSDAEDGIWLPVGTWKVTYRLGTGFGALPEHQIEVTTAHTEAAPLPLFANLGDPAPAGATLVMLQVPLGAQQGQVLVMSDGSLAWGDVEGGVGGGAVSSVAGRMGDVVLSSADLTDFTEATQDVVGAMVTAAGGTYNDVAGTITLPGGGSSSVTADDTPAAPAEGESASYLVTSAVSWPAGLVWSTDPDGGVAPTITGTALVSMFTVDGVTRAIMGATFPAVAAPADTTSPTWTATFTLGTPTSSSVVATASALATDNVAVTGYEVSYNGGSSWAAITPSGSNFTLAGTAGVTYATTKLRAKDAAANTSTPALSVPSYTMAASADTTAPTVGTMAASSITSSGFTLTVSGASDAGGLHATPYAFTTDGGATWTAYQASPVYAASGLAASTGYSCNWRVRDAAGNVSTGTAQTVTTEASEWGTLYSDTFTREADGALVGSAMTTGGKSWSTALVGLSGATANPATSAGDMVVSSGVVPTPISGVHVSGALFDAAKAPTGKVRFDVTYNPAGTVFADGILLIFGSTSGSVWYGLRLSSNVNRFIWQTGTSPGQGGAVDIPTNVPLPNYNSPNTLMIELDFAAKTIVGTVNSNASFIPTQAWPAGFTHIPAGTLYGVAALTSNSSYVSGKIADFSMRIA